MYSKTLFASWADMDFNAHMKNTAFLDKAADLSARSEKAPDASPRPPDVEQRER